jgi:hypothetical protein
VAGPGEAQSPDSCPYCGGRLRVIADVTDSAVIGKILDHLHQRAPPENCPVAQAQQYSI